jgi:formylglycine-generating enzyme
MKTDYNYDVVFSCAEEDLNIAKQIANSLKERGIGYYLYSEHIAENWGENIFSISLEKYGSATRYVLILISGTYVKKFWSQIELQIAQTVKRIGEVNIIPVRIDDTPVDGISKNISYVKWENNPEHIANLVSRKKNESEKEKKEKLAKKIVYNNGKQQFIADNIGTINIKNL